MAKTSASSASFSLEEHRTRQDSGLNLSGPQLLILPYSSHCEERQGCWGGGQKISEQGQGSHRCSGGSESPLPQQLLYLHPL